MRGYEKTNSIETNIVRFGVSFRQSLGFIRVANGTSLSKNSRMTRNQ